MNTTVFSRNRTGCRDRLNHTHAIIFSVGHVIADFRVLDGAATGATVRVVYREEVIPD